jgi:hypothetical protein
MSENRALKHFLQLARCGRSVHAGSGAKASFLLAETFLKYGLVLDDQAVEGFAHFMRSAKLAPETARELIHKREC